MSNNNNSNDGSSSDDEIVLSEHALNALKEFHSELKLKQQEQLSGSNFEEDWQLSQFWV